MQIKDLKQSVQQDEDLFELWAQIKSVRKSGLDLIDGLVLSLQFIIIMSVSSFFFTIP